MQIIEEYMQKIGILCPTRKRVEFLKRYINSIVTSADNPERCTFHFLIDDDDLETKSFLDETKIQDNVKVKYQIHKYGSVALSDMWNKLYETCDDEIIMISGDDAIMRSQHWDTIVSNIFNQIPDKMCLVYGRDGIHDQNFAAQFFLHRNWIETAGYIFPKYYTADWADTWVFEVSKMLQRSLFVKEIFLEHMHWSVGKSQVDETVLLAQARRSKDNNEFQYRSPDHFFERIELVKKLYLKIWEHAMTSGQK
jgi:hypothetical protein